MGGRGGRGGGGGGGGEVGRGGRVGEGRAGGTTGGVGGIVVGGWGGGVMSCIISDCGREESAGGWKKGGGGCFGWWGGDSYCGGRTKLRGKWEKGKRKAQKNKGFTPTRSRMRARRTQVHNVRHTGFAGATLIAGFRGNSRAETRAWRFH